MEDNRIPRRCDSLRLTPEEIAITDAIAAVENLPADARLTKAVTLLVEAREKVSDFVDGCGLQANGEPDSQTVADKLLADGKWIKSCG